MAQIPNTTQNTDTRPLTPEILTEQGWKIDEETSFYSCLLKDLDEVYCNEDDFTAYMMIKFGKKRDYVRFDIERDLGDSIRTNFKRKITVEEFNTLLDIVKLEKYKIK